MNLNIIGSGLRGTRSITLEQKDVLLKSDRIFVDSYTSIFGPNFAADLEEITGRPPVILDREGVESFSFLDSGFEVGSFIVSGDPFTSTTHYAIMNECRTRGIGCRIYENASITGSIPGRTGLSPYRTGIVVSIPRISANFVPVSPVMKIISNIDNGLHTTLLIDLDSGKNMDSSVLLETLTAMTEKAGIEALTARPAISLERLGWSDEQVNLNFLGKILENDLKSPYSIVIPSKPDSNELENMRGIFGHNAVKNTFGMF